MTVQRNLTATVRGDWRERLDHIVEMMREMSRQTDPQAMVRAYRQRVTQLMPVDRSISLSRRDLDPPRFRVTRSSTWPDDVNPWREQHRLPVLDGGLLGELIYGDAPRIIDNLAVEPDDPGAEFLREQRSLLAVPLYDQGVALNMVVLGRKDAGAFDPRQFPEYVWMANLFGRATHNLVLSEQVKAAYEVVDREMQVVGDIQRALLPAELPKIPSMDLAAHYETSSRAGGDYYDFFPLDGGRWGIVIADVSGHGTPAAVVMAITHALAHTHPGPPDPPGETLAYVNHHLAKHYTVGFGTFVTAFYGIYDSANRELTYACAGHNPPRVKRCGDGGVFALDRSGNLPLGITIDTHFEESTQTLRPGDQIVFYTDGITEAFSPEGEMFGVQRLDAVIGGCRDNAADIIEAVLRAVADFTAGAPADDDRTVLVAKIR